MKLRRLVTLTLSTAATLVVVLGMASAASAATAEQKLTVLGTFTQSPLSSYDSWNSARQNQGVWVDYAYDWSTDFCSASPDQPLGFDFRMPCWRHDFGYRNYKALGQFASNKDHIDSAFYADLKRKCATYNFFVRPSCYSLAWTYYEAVHFFGSLVVDSADIDSAAALKADGEAAAIGAGAGMD
jgi:Prokaryotic phospholipase A2